MKRKASAHWQGSTQEGSGTLSAQSGTLSDTPYSFKARFGDGKGTNPEELIAAAHAGCFTMAVSFTLNNAGFTAEVIDTEARADDGHGRRQADDHRGASHDARPGARTSTPQVRGDRVERQGGLRRLARARALDHRHAGRLARVLSAS